MGIESSVAGDIRNKELSRLSSSAKPRETKIDTKTNSNSNKAKKNRRRHKKTMTIPPVQKLFNTCMEVFANCGPGVVPSPENIDKLRAILDDIKPSDVGVTPDMPYFRKNPTHRIPAITYLHLYECDKFSMGIFCLPPSGVIPLHNHPGMTVFSKLLFGTMHIKSYDWVANVPSTTTVTANSTQGANSAAVRLAKLKVDSDFTAPCNTSILYPADGGNMHRFTGVTACAVLDVLGPPYSDPDGRHCTYYLEHPFSSFSVDTVSLPEEEKDGHAWLEERDKPDEFCVVGALYRGPKITEK